jgi:hypothetical protein
MITAMTIAKKNSGHYVIEFKDSKNEEWAMVGAAKESPVAQAIRLVERLLLLSAGLAGYNQNPR